MTNAKKYEMLEDNTITVDGKTLYRIRALKDTGLFGRIYAGDLGGYIESEKNLSQYGASWVYPGSVVFDSAVVKDDAQIINDSGICGNAIIYEDAVVGGKSWIGGNAVIRGCREITDFAIIDYGIHG